MLAQRTAHGALASLAFVILFPLGAIAMVGLNGRWALRVHAFVQTVAFVLFLAAAIIGFIMLKGASLPRVDGEGWFVSFSSFVRAHHCRRCKRGNLTI